MPVAVFVGGTLVMLFFALGPGDFQLGTTSYPVHGRWHDGIALAIDCTNELVQLVTVQQQFAATCRIRVNMG